MSKSKIGVVVFPGSNCDHDAYHAFKHILGCETTFIWHKDDSLHGVDMVVIPGGFSYGDYLRSGAIACFSPVMKAVVTFANKGGRVLGICNGFQILLESGLLPGAMLHNKRVRFACKHVFLRVESNDNSFSQQLSRGEILNIPIAHGEGNYHDNKDAIKQLNDRDQVVFRYVNVEGVTAEEANPNGSIEHIAGIINTKKNVLGMMPHPERAVETQIGGLDGLKLLKSALSILN